MSIRELDKRGSMTVDEYICVLLNSFVANAVLGRDKDSMNRQGKNVPRKGKKLNNKPRSKG